MAECCLTHPEPEFFNMTDAEMRPYVMRHNCKTDGCWNDIHRPRLELLKKCFGGFETRIKPQDIDGSVEHLGYFLFLEFKGSRGAFENRDNPGKPTAIDKYHAAITQQYRLICHNPITLSEPTTTSIYVVGDSKTMAIKEMRLIRGGEFFEWIDVDLYGLQKWCWEWFEKTKEWDFEDKKRRQAAIASRGTARPLSLSA